MEKLNGAAASADSSISAKAKIGEVAEQVLNSSAPVSVVDENGKQVGTLSRERITKALFGKDEQ